MDLQTNKIHAWARVILSLPVSIATRYHERLAIPSNTLYWILALLFGAAAGFTHVRLLDSGLSVLEVTAFTMFLSYQRPRLSWWWAAIVGLSLPIAALCLYLTRDKPSLGMVAGSFAGLAFAIVASVGGKVLRRLVAELFPPKKGEPPISE